MRKLLYALLAAVLLVVGGCYNEEPDEHPEDPAPTEDPSEPSDEVTVDPEKEEEFLESVAFDPYWEQQVIRDERRVINVGYHVCESIEDGRSIHEVSQELNQETRDFVAADHMIEAAVYTFCPAYSDNFEAHIAAHRG